MTYAMTKAAAAARPATAYEAALALAAPVNLAGETPVPVHEAYGTVLPVPHALVAMVPVPHVPGDVAAGPAGAVHDENDCIHAV